MIDHIVLNVSDLEKAKAFYRAALEPLGMAVVMEFEEGAGFGKDGKPEFWIGKRTPLNSGVHVAFRVDSRELVDAFYTAAMEAGGEDHGAPGVREMYHPHYYGGFVLDPDGNNIEAVCHLPQD